MALLVGIDGTGPFFNSTYAKEFEESFVNRIVRDSRIGGPDKRYFRGPIGAGGGMPEAINGGYDFIKRRRGEGNTSPILLTGYSRGAMGVGVIAKYLKDDDIPVAALLMFDCVDRHVRYDFETIPDNVAKVLHLRRDAKAGSRESFGNDGTLHSSATDYKETFYVCTHGGVGGTPWKLADGQDQRDFIDEGAPDGITNIRFYEDKIVSDRIWADVRPFITNNGFM